LRGIRDESRQYPTWQQRAPRKGSFEWQASTSAMMRWLVGTMLWIKSYCMSHTTNACLLFGDESKRVSEFMILSAERGARATLVLNTNVTDATLINESVYGLRLVSVSLPKRWWCYSSLCAL
jgi:hypothetical protein